MSTKYLLIIRFVVLKMCVTDSDRADDLIGNLGRRMIGLELGSLNFDTNVVQVFGARGWV